MNAKIGLQDIRFHGTHGYYEEENLAGNEFSIDVEVESNILSAATEDDLGGTVNYSTIYYLVQAEMKKETKLLESLAYRVAARIQHQFDSVTSVRVVLRKLHPPLGGKVKAAFVEVNLGGGGGGGGGSLPGSGMSNPYGGQQVFDETSEDRQPPGPFGGEPSFGGYQDMGGGAFEDDDEPEFDFEDFPEGEEDEGYYEDDEDYEEDYD